MSRSAGTPEPLDATGYLAPGGFEAQLRDELRDIEAAHGRLLLARGPPQAAHWAQNVWRRPFRLRIASIQDAARQLRSVQRNWALCSFAHHRRAALIESLLPHVAARPLVFPAPLPAAPLGSWTLIELDTILASAECSSPFPGGEARFVEPDDAPPTRAYLKLWEALTLLGRRPGPGDRCLDAGCTPGGWSWALARLGARVLAVDRAPLDPRIAALPGIEYRAASAFSVQPRDGPFDWICCDVACYPERLWTWVSRWLASGKCGSFVCTLKFQGRDHYGVIARFAAVPGSRLVHLAHNKHELTWMHPASSPAAP
jgi:23S rRNA (cytidine2498-2'-O)-methyltransferase